MPHPVVATTSRRVRESNARGNWSAKNSNCGAAALMRSRRASALRQRIIASHNHAPCHVKSGAGCDSSNCRFRHHAIGQCGMIANATNSSSKPPAAAFQVGRHRKRGPPRLGFTTNKAPNQGTSTARQIVGVHWPTSTAITNPGLAKNQRRCHPSRLSSQARPALLRPRTVPPASSTGIHASGAATSKVGSG